MKKIILIFLMLIISINVKAYENDIFKVDIDKSYKLELETTNAYRWTKDNNYIAISVNDNKKLKYNIEAYTKEDIENQEKYFEDGINKGISKYNIKADVTNIEKLNNNNAYYLEYDVYYPSKTAIGYDMYQKGRMFTTNKYIINIIYSSDKKLENSDDYKNVLNSLTILDNKTNDSNWFIYTFIAIGVIAGIIGAIISIKKNANK